MLFWERFYNLCLKNNIKPNAVCNKLGLSNATATHWKNGVIPKADIVLELSYHFNCSTDYLLGRSDELCKEKRELAVTQTTDPDEQRQKLLKNYDKMNKDGKNELVGLSEIISGNPKYLKADSGDNKIVS